MPTLFHVNATLCLHYFMSTLLCFSTTLCLHYFVLTLLYANTTLCQHYFMPTPGHATLCPHQLMPTLLYANTTGAHALFPVHSCTHACAQGAQARCSVMPTLLYADTIVCAGGAGSLKFNIQAYLPAHAWHMWHSGMQWTMHVDLCRPYHV